MTMQNPPYNPAAPMNAIQNWQVEAQQRDAHEVEIEAVLKAADVIKASYAICRTFAEAGVMPAAHFNGKMVTDISRIILTLEDVMYKAAENEPEETPGQ